MQTSKHIENACSICRFCHRILVVKVLLISIFVLALTCMANAQGLVSGDQVAAGDLPPTSPMSLSPLSPDPVVVIVTPPDQSASGALQFSSAVTAVPEPSTFALGSFALGLIAAARLYRNKKPRHL